MHHPTLDEVLSNSCLAEWIKLRVESLRIQDWVDAENQAVDRTNPEFLLLGSSFESELGSIAGNAFTVSLREVTNESLQTLAEERPVGSINFYDPNDVYITLNLNTRVFDKIIAACATRFSGLSLRISVPEWDDKTAKMLPLLSYQIRHEVEA